MMYEKIFKYIEISIKNNLNIVPISLNVSAPHIKNNNFMVQFTELINKYNFPVNLIEMEITENVFVYDIDAIRKFINNLKKIGVKVSIDDFGTAYSSLNTLKEVEVDLVKLDKGFLHTVEKSKDNRKLLNKDKVIIKHIVEMGKDLEIDVLCEGIETVEQIQFLKTVGCELGQGYVFSKPRRIYRNISIIYN